MDDDKFTLNYSEALLIRQILERAYLDRPPNLTADEKKEAERLQWKIKDAFN